MIQEDPVNRFITSTLTALATLLLCSGAFAQAPGLIPVQGYLVDFNGVALDGSFDLTTAVYDAATAGNQLHTETQTVDIDQGFFTVYLGATGSGDFDLALFADNEELWLGLAVDQDAELDPRIRMGTSGYAGHAKSSGDADNLGGVAATDYALFSDTISDLTCSTDGEVLAWDASASAWTCTAVTSGGAETDPVYTASPAAGVTNLGLSNWDTAFGWGDHGQAGYLTTEADPTFTGSPVGGVTSTQVTAWDTQATYGDHSAAGYLTSESDPAFTASPVSGVTSTQVTAWDTQATYGDHAAAGYLNATTADASYVNATGDDVTGILTVVEPNPRIRLDDSDVSGVEWAFKANGEDFELYEPEDSSKVHFRIVDQGDIQLSPNGVTALTASPNGNVTVAGAVSATSYSGDGSGLSGVLTSEVDGSTTNELVTGFALSGNTLSLTDAGGTTSVDLAGYDGDFVDVENGNATVSLSGSDSTYPDTGVALRTQTNPASGDAIFRVLSSAGAERLRVEHDGAVSMDNTLAVLGTGTSTFAGPVTATSFSGSGAGITGLFTQTTADGLYVSNAGDNVTGDIVMVNSATLGFDDNDGAGSLEFGIHAVGENLQIYEPETNELYMEFVDAGAMNWYVGGDSSATPTAEIVFATNGDITTLGDVTAVDGTFSDDVVITDDLTVGGSIASGCPTGTTYFGGWCMENGSGTDANGGSNDTWNIAQLDCTAKGMQICPSVAYIACDNSFGGSGATLACEYETDNSAGVDGLYTSDFAPGGSFNNQAVILYAAGNNLALMPTSTNAEWLCCTPAYNP